MSAFHLPDRWTHPLRRGQPLALRQWLLIVWLAYALLPGVVLGILWVTLRLILGSDPLRIPAALGVMLALSVAVQFGIPVVTAILTGRAVLRPLGAIRVAARAIAAGNLDFVSPPAGGVREVHEVATAFSTMGAGLRAALARQAELEEERRFFFAAIAHDLRTPLFALRGYLQGVQSGVARTPAQAAHYLAVCQAKADELESLVEDLFMFAKLDYPEFRLDRVSLNLAGLMNQTIESFMPTITARHLALRLTGDPAATVEADPHLLARALANLLDNAIHYTPESGTITVHWGAHPILFSVADTGPGIPIGELPHLFEPLYRGEASRNRATGGAGLGLTIAQRIVRAHGWELAAENQSAGGAIFAVIVPEAAG